MRSFIWILFLPLQLVAQLSLSGIVSSDKGDLLPYALVFLDNTPISTLSDSKGKFVINDIVPGYYTLKVQFVGYPNWEKYLELRADTVLDITLSGGIYNLSTVEIQSNRVGQNDPFTHSTISKEYIQKENLGQDLTVLMQWQPSVVTTSDAGAGIGYTSMQIRGSDQTRINVTLNGVPVNDAESHNVFWVNMPNLAGNTSNIQIQRGVGTSTHGAGAFGGTVSINTHELRPKPFIEMDGSLGSFNTNKYAIGLGSGLLNKKYFVEARYSGIQSDGYIDRATSDLRSLYFSAGRITSKSSLRFNYLDGREVTYQSWNGAPQALVNGDADGLRRHFDINQGSLYRNQEDSLNLLNSGRTYNYYTYPNQVDNYNQKHYQLIYALNPNENWRWKSTLYYTKGRGYFEQFRYQDRLRNYGIPNVMIDDQSIERSTIVRRRWLDNDLIGAMVDGEYTGIKNWTLQSGINANYYIGDHFGDIVSSSVEIPELSDYKRYYDNVGKKLDYMGYLRGIFTKEKLSVYGDLQLRYVDYTAKGLNNDRESLDIQASQLFFNPKLGLTYELGRNQQAYASYAVAHKEPTRRDFTDNTFDVLPRPEQLQNLEVGYRVRKTHLLFESNIYYMLYRDQLVLTGELNDVGAPIRINVPRSYRLGWENSLTYQISEHWIINTNATISRNKIEAFDEIIPDYTQGFDKIVIPHQNTDISFSPNLIGALQIMYRPIKNFELEWSSKYVGRQFMDNTSDIGRSLDAYNFHNLRLLYKIPQPWLKEVNLTLLINNITNNLYSSNGFTYSYIFGELITENFLYPQAGTNFLVGLNVKF